MKGNFSRDTFDASNHFSQVLMQQGRVTLDADYNEQTAILLHYLRTLARDLIGPYAAPSENAGFALTADDHGIWVGAGRYYVDGLLVENESPCLYTAQPDYQLPDDDSLAKDLKDKKKEEFWIYLDVWERHITSLEMDAIREKALGGPDTCSRARIVWQVKALQLAALQEKLKQALDRAAARRDALNEQIKKANDDEKPILQIELRKIESEITWRQKFLGPPDCATPLGELTRGHAWLAATVKERDEIGDACITPPDSKYRGTENQLYRVEIHRGGNADSATFKWSRDNGSAATAWLDTTGNDIKVANAREFSKGDWVELSDDIAELQGKAGVLVRLTKVEGGTLSFDPTSTTDTAATVWSPKLLNPKVRRWGQIQIGDVELVDGAVPIKETPTGKNAKQATWIDLEDGIQVAFAAGGDYRTGDYWLIPARVASGNIEWPPPKQPGQISLVKSHGITHYYAPLGLVSWPDDEFSFDGCACEFKAARICVGIKNKAVAPPLGPLAAGGRSATDSQTGATVSTPATGPTHSAPARRRATKGRSSKKGKRGG